MRTLLFARFASDLRPAPVFDHFFTTRPTGDGTGLALSMSHDIIVRRHGVNNEEEEETMFVSTLPAAAQPSLST